MTIRQWMSAVAVVAMIAATLIEAGRSWERHRRYASALRSFQECKVNFDEGRRTLEYCVERSQLLLEAELPLRGTKPAQVAAIRAHLARASSLMEEINWPESLHDDAYRRAASIAEARESLRVWEARLSDLLHSP